MDSVVKSNSLSNASSQSIRPYLKASLPLKSIRINSKYGMRKHPVMHKTIMHHGVNLAVHYEKVFSMLPGEVIGVGQDYRSGKFVTVRTGGYIINYCHLSSFLGSKRHVCKCRRCAWVIRKFGNVNRPSSASDNKKGWQGV